MEFRKLERKLEEYPKAIGIGEIGIDHTTRCKCCAFHNKDCCREEKIETQCQFLHLGKVIVLHVRSHDNLGLQQAPIQRHCIMGGGG